MFGWVYNITGLQFTQNMSFKMLHFFAMTFWVFEELLDKLVMVFCLKNSHKWIFGGIYEEVSEKFSEEPLMFCEIDTS